MGFKDAEWAYSLDLPSTAKVVLAALALRTDDKTHRTIVGQDTVAAMVGMSPKSVQRAIGVLESEGVLSRRKRFRKDGAPTSAEVTLHPEHHETESPVVPGDAVTTGQSDHRSVSPEPLDSLSSTTGLSVPAYKDDHPEGHSVGHSVTPLTPTDRFAEFYSTWPKKVDRPAAVKAWAKAISRTSPDRIIAAAIAYRDNPGLPSKQFIRNPATWLNGDGWEDDLPELRGAGNAKPTPTDRARQTMATLLGTPQSNITALPMRELAR